MGVAARHRPALLGAARAVAYRGQDVACPCCARQFRAFRAHRGRPGARCPGCGALERHRALWLWLEERTELTTAPLRLLHVAPEYELQRRLERLPRLEYLSADLDSPLAMVRTDVMDMQFGDAEFDVVLCNHVLEHVADDRRAMAEIRRVLRPGGWAVLLVPVEHDRASTFEDPAIVDPAERLRVYGQEDHARVYGRDYPERLRAAGFDVEIVDGAAGRAPEEVRRYGLARAGRVEEIYVARRPIRRAASRLKPGAADAARARVLLITPVRNEARHLRRVARAVAAQTQPPARWVVVDDGSTDGTHDLLERLAEEIPFLEVLRAPPELTPPARDRLAAAAAPRAFRWALARTGLEGFSHVGKLDGDTELPPRYLETLLARLEEEPGLGIAGGVRVEERGDRRIPLDRPGEHVPGALKLYTASCWQAIGGVPETLAWDAIDEVRAHLHGYDTRSYGDLVAVHHRAWGTADGRVRGRMRFGRSLHVAGYPLWWVVPKALRMTTLPPTGVSGAFFLWGYLDARLRRVPRVEDAAYARQLRRDLKARLNGPGRKKKEVGGVGRAPMTRTSIGGGQP